MSEESKKSALSTSADFQSKIDRLFAKTDVTQYNLRRQAGKGCAPERLVALDRRWVNKHGERLVLQWQDFKKRAAAPAYRTYRIASIAAPLNMRVQLPDEDYELSRRPRAVFSGEVYALLQLLQIFKRGKIRREVRRNPAVPLDLGYRKDNENEARWEFLCCIEPDDFELLQALGYHRDSDFDEDIWEEILRWAQEVYP